MIKTNWILIILLLLLFASCIGSGQQKNKRKTRGDFVLSDSIAFAIDTNTSTVTRTFYYYNDKRARKEYFVYYDLITSKITFLNFASKKVDFKIKIDKTGKYAISNIAGFVIKNIDSIYVFSGDYTIYLLNKAGTILSTIKYIKSTDIPAVPLSSFSKFHTNAIITGNIMYALAGDGNYDYRNINDPSGYNFCYMIDLKNSTINKTGIHHPKKFWSKGIRELTVSWDYNNQFFIYSPLFSDDIYISKDNIKIDKIVTIKSNLISGLRYYNPNKPVSWEKYTEMILSYQQYLGIVYDKYRNIYYRFFWPGMDISNMSNEEIRFASKNRPNFGIMILDSNFNILCETVLPLNKYLLKWFVNKKGLGISFDHPKNKQIKENEWKFHIFTYHPIFDEHKQ